MSYVFDFTSQLIEIIDPQVTVDIQELINVIRTAEASEEGITYDQIASASGKESLGGSVSVGITVQLLDWQLHFWEGTDYTATISGGNLVGGVAGDSIAYTAGVQVIVIQSAASTVVATGGSALTTEEHNQLMAAPTAATIASTVWASVIETGFTAVQSMRLILAVLVGKLSGAATTTIVIRDVNDTKDRITATVDTDGNRTAVTKDVS